MTKKRFFEEVDDCILAAYKHVTRTGFKMKNHFDGADGGSVGLVSEDGSYFMMWMELHKVSTKRKLARRIIELKIPVVDFMISVAENHQPCAGG